MSFLSKKNMIFCFKNLIFSEYEWAIANCSWEWNNLSNVIYFQNKVWYFRCSIIRNSSFLKFFWTQNDLAWITAIFCFKKYDTFLPIFFQNPELWPPGVGATCSPRSIWHWGVGKYHLKYSQLKRFGYRTITRFGGSKKPFFCVWCGFSE